MARIRSVHPGLFTDEAFMSASAYARLLMIGVWCEAWDDGVFEWKPLTLKAKLFPVDNVDVTALLAELEGLNVIREFEASGKRFGAVRNFGKYQRPKKPNSSGVLPSDLHLFTAYSETSYEPVPNQPPTPSEKSPQMEDGGGKVKKEEPSSEGSARPKRKTGFVCPPDFIAKPRHYESASAKGLGPEWVDEQVDRMRSWSVANENREVARKSDWDAALDGWLKKQIEDANGKRVNGGSYVRENRSTIAALDHLIDFNRHVEQQSVPPLDRPRGHETAPRLLSSG